MKLSGGAVIYRIEKHKVTEMEKNRYFRMLQKNVLSGIGLCCAALLVSCGPTPEDKVAAESDCKQLASARSGYNPGSASSGKSNVGKGAAVGAVGGAAVGALTSNKSKKVVQGAAVGAAAGAGVGVLKDKDNKKKAAQASSVYNTEYQHCMKGKGF